MSLRRLMARAAGHRDAITAARMAGWTWTEIGERLGVSGEAMRRAYSRAQAAMQVGRLVPLEQTPLPEPAPPIATPVPPTAKPKPAPSLSEPLAGEQRQERPGWTTIPLDKPLNK